MLMGLTHSIAVLVSHSALDVLDDARDEGFRTIAIAKKGKKLPYKEFLIIDELIVLNDFRMMVGDKIVSSLRNLNAVFVPSRSFVVYVGYDDIE